ncbi:MAG: hypothetical protein U9N41_03000 [Euryarchaeota archaeon]|nr:hypothetical protein [Euryarchaeota archaeon]
MSEEENKFKEDFRKLVKGLIALCPAYNSATRILRDTREKSIAHVGSAYPEIFDAEILPVLTSVFGFSPKPKVEIEGSSVGYDLLTLGERLEKLLDDKGIREIIGRSIGEEPPNPAKDYVEISVKAIAKDDQTALKLLRIAAGETSYVYFDTLISKVKEQFGLELDKEKLVEHLTKLDSLGLLYGFWEDRIQVKEHYKRHIIDLAKIE